MSESTEALCSRKRGALVIPNGVATRETIPCNEPACHYCGPRLKKRYIRHFIEAFRGLPNVRRVTLTVETKSVDRHEQVALLRQVMSHFLSRMSARLKKRALEVKYLLVIDLDPVRLPQALGVIGADITDEEICQSWVRSGGAVSCEAASVDSEPQMASWLGRTLKGLFGETRFSMPGLRQIRVSQGLGYHAAPAKTKRREFMREQEAGVVVRLDDEAREEQLFRWQNRKRALSTFEARSSDPVPDTRRNHEHTRLVRGRHAYRVKYDLKTGKLNKLEVVDIKRRDDSLRSCRTFDEAKQTCVALDGESKLKRPVRARRAARLPAAPLSSV